MKEHWRVWALDFTRFLSGGFHETPENKFLRQRKRDEKQVRPIFKEAYNSVAASHTETAFTWGQLYASSSDPVFAADVVNAYMDSLAELELELLNKRKASSVESLALCYYRLVKRREKMSRIVRMFTN